MIRRRAAQGYVMLTVVMLAALIVAGVAAFCRNALIGESQDVAALDHLQAHEALASGLDYARQALVQPALPSPLQFELGPMTVTVGVAPGGAGVHEVDVAALRGALGTRRLAAFETTPVPGAEIPPLAADVVTALASGGDLFLEDGDKLEDTVVAGDVVVEAGAKVTFEDCVVVGSIVSQAGLAGPPYHPDDALEVVVRSGLRIEGRGAATGLAVYAPGGTVEGDGDTRIEWHGAVVADSVELEGQGALTGLLIVATDAWLSPAIDRPGTGRGPEAWPAALQPRSWRPRRVAFLVEPVSAAEQTAIAAFPFPAQALQAVSPGP